ncbi:MAG: sigma factor-like helix-turn-helix DNA-binding protein [bacterium]|nr:sigma factor-like helix-turn-helix DNA-binding protein [bacterium]
MENKSILETILDSNVQEEASILDSQLILENLFSALREKEQDIIRQRFGLFNNDKVTLEAIGKSYNLTRERIRQIENFAINKIRKHDEFIRWTASLKHIINSLLEEHGGIVERQYLIDNLSYLSLLANSEQKLSLEVLRNHYDFILSKLLADHFDYVKENDYYHSLWKLKYSEIDHLKELLVMLLTKLKDMEIVLPTHEIIKLIKDSDEYKRHNDRLNVSNNFDISPVIKSERYNEDFNLINENKSLYSLLRSSKNLKQNKFGFWGLTDWSEIIPKTINHKIYLILKHEGKPLHFKEIANRINEISFDHKRANPATVHNELILDDKYILIGRGIYALKEWGYSNGTVTDVVASVIKEAGRPLTKDEIIEKVMDKRLVKRATINLALMDKTRFNKEGDKYQTS